MISNGTVKSIGPRLVCSFLLVLVVALTGSHVALADTQSSLSQAKTQAATLEAQLKDLDSGEQREIALDQLAAALKG